MPYNYGMQKPDILAILLSRAADGDEDCAAAATEIAKLRGIAGRAARATKCSRDISNSRKALNPKMRVNTRGMSLPEKIKARVVEDPLTGCWVWQGACCGGYARLRRGNGPKPVYCHRIMYEHHYGPIPDGHVVMHSCDNKRCVNPEHLRAGTQKDNIRDMHAKGRSTRTILSPEEVREIREKHSTGIGIDKLAAEFGVGTYSVHKIVSGKAWSWV